MVVCCLASSLLSAQGDRGTIIPARPDSGRRLALVIGNDAYPWKPLINAVNDARSLAQALPQAGFAPQDITLVTNTTLKQLQRAARMFVERVRAGDVALVYYSGHGMEVRGENYLVPVDFPADATELEVQDEAYSAQELLRNLESSPAKVRLLILDACRDNPLRATRSSAGGLARMDGQGTLIVFATSAGKTASDNPRGGNGLFTGHLLKALPTPGLPIDQMIKQVAREVYRDSGGLQTPAIYGLLLEDFAFVAGSAAPSPTPNPPRIDAAAEAWALIKDSQYPDDFERFARAFPSSDLAQAAEIRAAQLRRPTIASPSQVEPLANRPSLPLASNSAAGMPRINQKDGLKYVWVPPGRFTMGCSMGDTECSHDEQPTHEVIITKGFWLGQTPVTQAAYMRVTGSNPSHFKGNNRPVESITWDEARSYCKAIGGRLPTEAEWEYAARAGSKDARYGSVDEVAWYENNSGGKTHEVGEKQSNALGLYDMLGNVWQWTADWYAFYQAGREQDPPGPSGSQWRARRGGSWVNSRKYARVSSRLGYEPSRRLCSIGMRCVGE